MKTAVTEKPILFSAPMVRAILDGRKTMTRRVVGSDVNDAVKVRDIAIQTGFREYEHQFHFCDASGDTVKVYGSKYGKPGDRLWVRETFCQKAEDGRFVYNSEGNLDPSCYHYAADGYEVLKDDGDGGTEYRKDGRTASPWKSSRCMPRWASRITLEVTDVRVERLQEITEEYAIAEGFVAGDGRPVNGFCTESPFTAVSAFRSLWEELNGKRGICKTCKGHGVVPAWAGSVSGGSLMQDSKDCPDCHGKETGFGWDQNPWVWVVEFKRID